MSPSRVHLFRGNSLVVPESLRDDEAPDGIDRDDADRAFGGLEYCTVLPPGLTGPPMECFLFKDDAPLPSGWRLLPLRDALSILALADGGLYDRPDRRGVSLLRAFHIVQWRKDSVYCGSCGEKNGDSPDELARLCPRCGRIEYPRITPAVIVLISDGGDRILLAHNKKFKDRIYSLIAGFAEAGESLEAAACREIKEELNIEIKDLRYIKSQSWPFPNSLMLGFSARFAGGEIRPDGDEIVDARWFNRETIRQSMEGNTATGDCADGDCFVPQLPGPASIARYLIDRWLYSHMELFP